MIDLPALFRCFDPVSTESSSIEDAHNGTSGVAARGVPGDFTMETFSASSEEDQLSAILCLVGVLLPPALVSDILRMLSASTILNLDHFRIYAASPAVD